MTPDAELELRPVGERGLLVCVPDNAHAQRLAAHVRARLGAELEEIVPGHETVLLVGRRARPDRSVLAGCPGSGEAERAGPAALQLDVRYDGEDLAAIAADCGLSPEEVVRRHAAARYTVAFLGFAPGFAYLIGGDSQLRPPRLASPRERVPAGAVAVAGEYSAVYPRSSPGGWRLIGHTEAVMFDASREPPALAAPGMGVRFRAVN